MIKTFKAAQDCGVRRGLVLAYFVTLPRMSVRSDVWVENIQSSLSMGHHAVTSYLVISAITLTLSFEAWRLSNGKKCHTGTKQAPNK